MFEQRSSLIINAGRDAGVSAGTLMTDLDVIDVTVLQGVDFLIAGKTRHILSTLLRT